ncbi:MAG: hypothetical protein AAF483_16835 [Planctomycetota bacterium]
MAAIKQPDQVCNAVEDVEEFIDEIEAAIRRLAIADSDPDANDIQTIRSAVLARLRRKLGSSKCDLWWFLREQCGYSDKQIRNHLFDGQPKDLQPSDGAFLLQIYAELITANLLRRNKHRCGCWERYQDTIHPLIKREGKRKSRKSADMRRECNKIHWIQGYGEQHNDGRRSEKQPLAWLHTAVDGNVILKPVEFRNGQISEKGSGYYRDLGNSMLIAVFETPAGTGLYLIGSDQNWRLLDSRQIERNDPAILDDDGSFRSAIELFEDKRCETPTVFYCTHCREIVGRDGKHCRGKKCVWEIVERQDWSGVELQEYKANVFSCGQHFWPCRGLDRCPVPRCSCHSLGADAIKDVSRWTAHFADLDPSSI